MDGLRVAIIYCQILRIPEFFKSRVKTLNLLALFPSGSVYIVTKINKYVRISK